MQGLPAWNILLLARKPFAVALHDCSAIPAVLSSANAKVRHSAMTFLGILSTACTWGAARRQVLLLDLELWEILDIKSTP